MRLPGSRNWGTIVSYLHTEDGNILQPHPAEQAFQSTLPGIDTMPSSPANNDEFKIVQKMLAIRGANLEVLERQAATLGGNTPTHLKEQIASLKAAIEELNKRLETL